MAERLKAKFEIKMEDCGPVLEISSPNTEFLTGLDNVMKARDELFENGLSKGLSNHKKFLESIQKF